MVPLTAATLLATVVGLLCNYKGEKDFQKSDDYEQFVAWLTEKRHGEIVSMLRENLEASESVKYLLGQESAILLEKLGVIDEILVSLCSRIDGIDRLAKAIKPGVEIPEQAVALIEFIDSCKSSSILEAKTNMGSSYSTQDGKREEFTPTEERFIEDDLNVLVEYGFLREDYTKSGNRKFFITRNAVNYLQVVK